MPTLAKRGKSPDRRRSHKEITAAKSPNALPVHLNGKSKERRMAEVAIALTVWPIVIESRCECGNILSITAGNTAAEIEQVRADFPDLVCAKCGREPQSADRTEL